MFIIYLLLSALIVNTCTMSSKSCCVPGCLTKQREGVTLHRFPDPETDTARFKIWKSKIGGDITHNDAHTVFANRIVCHKHFESRYVFSSNRLSKIAIPTLFLPAPQAADQLLALPSTSAELHSEKTQTAIRKISPKQQSHRIHPSEKVQIKKILSKLSKLEKDNVSLKYKYMQAKKICKAKAFQKLSDNMPYATKLFCGMQIRQSVKKSKGRRFSLEEKILALSIYKPSPKAYRALSNVCALPSRRTLHDLLHKVNVKPGINNVIFEHLKNRVSKMPENHKYCALLFDEMAICPSLTYDKKEDGIVGLVDNGVTKEKNYCDHVLVFLIRGVVKKYKQPVAFTYCKAATKTAELKRQIILIIQKIQETGLKVIATICDQGTSNISAINGLIAQTTGEYLRNGLEYTGGFFEVGEEKIYPIFDPPHLIKGVRNNLLTKDLRFHMGDRKCLAKWSHVEALYNRGPGYKGIKLVPKLTAKHVVPGMIPKMKVKNCTQVFSQSVGVAMGFMAESGALPKESTDTADLLILLDQLFDSVNGSYSEVQKGKIYRSALTPTSPHHRLWAKILPVIKSMVFIGKKKQGVVPSLTSWVKTIEGFKLIFKYLQSKGISSLLLRNFNQDPLENFFGAVRAHGCSNIMPTAWAFEAAYKTLMINNISSSHSIGANCEKDDAICLQSLTFLLSMPRLPREKNDNHHIMIEPEHLMIDLIDTQKLIEGHSPIQIEKTAATAYCCGWMAQLAMKQISKYCTQCKENLLAEEEPFHKFIKKKEYCTKKLLCYPSRELFDFFCYLEQICRDVLGNYCNKEKIADYISIIVATNLNTNFIKCSLHKDKMSKFLISKSIEFFIRNWCKDVNSVLTGKSMLCDESDKMICAAHRHYELNRLRKRKMQNVTLVNL